MAYLLPLVPQAVATSNFFGGMYLMKTAGMALILMGLSSVVFAGVIQVPEISPATGVGALALLSGAVLVIRGRRRQ
jgi:hypothetical protein